MLAAGRDELACDLAETYGILDYRGLPARRLAVLAAGLREDSRIKLRMSGARVPLETLLLASIADALNALLWRGAKRGKRPASFVGLLTGTERGGKRPEEQPIIYSSGAAFDAAWARLTGGGGHA